MRVLRYYIGKILSEQKGPVHRSEVSISVRVEVSVNERTERLDEGSERLCKFGLRDRNHVAYDIRQKTFI